MMVVMVNMYVDTQEALVHSKANLYVSRMEHRRRCLSPGIFFSVILFFCFDFFSAVILSRWDTLSETWEMKFVLSFHVTTHSRVVALRIGIRPEERNHHEKGRQEGNLRNCVAEPFRTAPRNCTPRKTNSDGISANIAVFCLHRMGEIRDICSIRSNTDHSRL